MNIMGFILILILILILPAVTIILSDSILRLIYLVVVSFRSGDIPKRLIDKGTKKQAKTLYLLPVHNEDQIIGATISRLKLTLNEQEHINIYVIADHCSDQTGEIASLAGANVFFRTDGQPGKGPALSWFALNYFNLVAAVDIIIILDADTIIEKSFNENILDAFDPAVDVVQSFVFPISSERYLLTILASFSELLSQYVDDTTRSILSWPVPLRGTGMAFRSTIFCSLCYGLTTQVDDIELSIRLASKGISVSFAPEAILYDPKSSNMFGLARQRGRWLKGQRQIFSVMKADLREMLWLGLPGWSLMQSLLFKPKTLLMIVKIILVFICCFINVDYLRYILGTSLLTSILIDLLYYFWGLKYVSKPIMYLSALLKAPLYIALWFASWVFSIIPGHRWLSSRH